MKRIIFTTLLMMTSSAFAVEDSCGQLVALIIDTTNPPGKQIQVTLQNKKKIRRREDISEVLAQRPETIHLLLKAQNDPKLEVCLTSFVQEKGYQTLGLMVK
jgi:hypothetical protein